MLTRTFVISFSEQPAAKQEGGALPDDQIEAAAAYAAGLMACHQRLNQTPGYLYSAPTFSLLDEKRSM